MIIDMHGHVTAPPEFYAYKSGLLASRGYHGKGSPGISDERMHQAARRHLDLLEGVGTDVQFLSPRPFQLMHSEQPQSIVRWWVEANNDLIARQCRAYPDVFRGVCALPQAPGGDLRPCVEELERCVKQQGFIGCLLNPDPTEGTGLQPTLDDEYWYPLYEKMVELDVPALVHSTACRNPRESYSAHFIAEESLAILNLCKTSSRVFKDFPGLRLIISHGGGAVPYQAGLWRSGRFPARGANACVPPSHVGLYGRHLRRFAPPRPASGGGMHRPSSGWPVSAASPEPESPPVFSARGLTMRFGNFTAVDGVDLEVGEGEIHALVGPNG